MKRLVTMLIIGTAALLIGALIFGAGVMLTGGASGGRTVEYKEITESSEIDRIEIEYLTADIVVRISDTAERVTVSYPVTKDKNGDPTSNITAECKDGTLKLAEESIWHKNIFSFMLETATVTVTVPSERVLTYDIECNTGNIVLEDGIVAESVKLSCDTGAILIGKCVVGERIDAETDTGRIELRGEAAAEHISLSTDTGRVTLSASVIANTVSLETDTGRVSIDAPLRAAKLGIKTSTGDVSVTEVIDAHVIEARSSTGDVSLLLLGVRALYTAIVDTSTGDSNLKSGGAGERTLWVTTSTGDIRISFADEDVGESL